MIIWAKIWSDNQLIKDLTVTSNASDTRTHKIFAILNQICTEWDLPKPIWLDSNISEFKKYGSTRFSQDSFIESVDFDYLEFVILEED